MAADTIAINLKRLRSSRGFSQGDLAKKAGLSRIAYSNVENGKANPRVSNLQQIANVLQVSIQDLVTPVPNVGQLRFRCKTMSTGRKKSSRDQIVADIAFWLRDYSGLEERLEKKYSHVLKGIRANDPQEYAAKVRAVLKIKDDEPINDICGLLEHYDFKIKFIKSDLKEFFGLSAFDQHHNPAIVVNVREGISVERQIFTVAHELGHIVMHGESFKANETNQKEEEEATKFASYFLMPEKALRKSLEENKGLHWLQNILHIKRFYRVSFKTVILRLIDFLGIDKERIWPSFYREYQKQYNEKIKDNREPKPLDPLDFVEERLSALTKEALDKELISVSRAAEILNITVEEMRERINAWSLVNESASV